MPERDDLPEGFKMTEFGPLPESWQAVELGRIAVQSFGGGTPSTKESGFWNGPIPWTTTAVIEENDIYLKTFQRGITDKGLQQSSTRLAPKGSVLIGTRVGVGKAVVTTFDVAINQDLTVIVLQPNALPEFVVLALKSPSLQQLIADRKRGTTIKGIPRDDILTVPIPFPSLPEQRATAHVLLTVQQAKETTERVIAATRELKKSLMRHLFTYGPVPVDQADKVPQKETEIGLVPEHWKIEKLGEIVERGGSIQTGPFGSLLHSSDYVPQGIPIVMPKDLSEQGKILTTGIARIGDQDFKRLDRYHLRLGDLLVARRGELGRRGVVTEQEAGWVCGTGCLRLRPSHLLDTRFLSYAFETNWLRGWLASNAIGTTMANLSAQILKRMPTLLPSMEEQKQIAFGLQAVDKKIETEENRKRALDTLFKTLLHHLMTGKVRVKDLQLPASKEAA